MRLFIVQVENSGIPDTPEVFVTEGEANQEYVDLWREKLGINLDAELPEDFDEDWPEDGGVRMWSIDVPDLDKVVADAIEADLEWGEPGSCWERLLDQRTEDEGLDRVFTESDEDEDAVVAYAKANGLGHHYGNPHCIYCLQGD